ncbi:MAG: hypothetical protein IJX14_11770 [Clostridia bacterium]|nr:hypothetical protein [Clostridia bacterium]
MKKTIFRMVCAVLVLVCMGISVTAAVISPAEPYWDNVRQVNCNVNFNGTRGTVTCDILAVTGTTSITGTLTLYADGREIDNWDIDVDTSHATILDSFTGLRGSVYELVLDIDVVTNGVSEPIEITDITIC